MFPRDVVCLRNISVDTLHKGDIDDDDNNNNNNDNNNTSNEHFPFNLTACPILFLMD
jgi:hypothetical protein